MSTRRTRLELATLWLDNQLISQADIDELSSRLDTAKTGGSSPRDQIEAERAKIKDEAERWTAEKFGLPDPSTVDLFSDESQEYLTPEYAAARDEAVEVATAAKRQEWVELFASYLTD